MLDRLKSLGSAAENAVKSIVASFQTPATPAGVPRDGSLDSPQLDIKDDILNRHRLAREIYRIICNQAARHSVRIGLFGDWGYGKTTIAHWVEALAEGDGHIVVWFNPWSVGELSELWLSFSIALRNALRRHKVTIPSGTEAKSTLADIKRDYGQLAESVNGGKILSGVAAAFLRFTKADIEALTRSLQGRRVVVIIDDIDRADPKLLPQLFLSLRELLDVPGFAFLVPFEKSIVAEALLQEHGPWGSGERFLERILDFQITIPTSTVDARWELFSKHVADFVSPEALADLRPLHDLLPDNPRRIKRTARMFELVSHEVKRHKVDEIDWVSLLMGFMIKLESEEFFERYVEETFRDTQARLAESVMQEEGRREEAIEKRIADAIAAARIGDEELQERLKTLARCWEKERSYWHDARVSYTLRMFDLPDAFTWAEIDGLLAAWTEAGDIGHVEGIVREKADALCRAEDRVVKELVEALAGKYHQHLEAAANSFSAADHAREAEAAATNFARIESLVFSAIVDADNRIVAFEKLFETYGTWAHFTSNEADAALREVEQRVLRRLLDGAADRWPHYAEKLKENRVFERPAFDAFVQTAQAGFTERASAAALDVFRSKDGARRFIKGDVPAMSSSLVLDPQSPLWTGEMGRAPMELVLQDAAQVPDIQRSAHHFLDMASGRHDVPMSVSLARLREFLRNERIAIAFWNAAIAQPIQYRMLMDTRAIRRLLIHGGVAEQHLAFPDWLHVGEERDQRQ